MEKSIDIVNQISFTFTPRLALATSLLHLSVEHRNAIHVSVKHGLIGSAHSLLRPQLEAACRAFWINDHASDADIEKFAAGAEPPSIGKMLSALKDSERFDGSLLASIKDKNWKILCDFTHGGSLQALLRVSDASITAGFNPADRIEILDFSASIAAFVVAGIADIVGDSILVNRAAIEFNAIYRTEA